MYRTHEPLVAIRRLVAVLVVFSLLPCGELMATLDAASPAQSSHRWSDRDADQARRMVMNRGVGRDIEIRLRSGEWLRGEIREIADDYFVLAVDGTTASVDIAYDDLRQVGPIVLQQPVTRPRPKHSFVGAVVVVAALIFMAAVEGCSHTTAC